MDGGFTKKKCQKSMSCCRFHYRVGAFSSDNIRYHLKQYALKNVSVRTGENKPKRNRIRGAICFVFVHTNTFLCKTLQTTSLPLLLLIQVVGL